ncbi:MAG TPA: GTPase HflX [Bacteroidales bacterium]|nr:GTPase HflX [Bacteroidales bacterium]
MSTENTYNNKAVLVAWYGQDQSREKTYEYLDELRFLAETAGIETTRVFTQKLEKPSATYYIGKGKLEEIKNYVLENRIGFAIFDDELSPTQLRNIENSIEVRVLDRTHLILDIFAMRAKTSYAKTQVELAQYQYLLPRLTRLWTHLERQRGGIGLRGPGETEIETDRRVIRDRIAYLKEELKQIDKQMLVQRKNRGKVIRVALVGYTNAGKSTLMNVLSKSEVFAENKLFATLDTTTRKVVINNLPFLLSDTVGFIRKLPHHLVESFKSTLDETRDSDLLIHVADISHPSHTDHIESVKSTLRELGVHEKPLLMVFNKTDLFSSETEELAPEQLQIARENSPCLFVSAKTGLHIAELKEILFEKVRELHFERYPYNTI